MYKRNIMMKNQKIIERFEDRILKSYAHNSPVYLFFEKMPVLNKIVEFLNWDAKQPPFYEYLQAWTEHVPDYLVPPLAEHIKEEVDEEHSKLFTQMLTYLKTFSPQKEVVNSSILRQLNYTFNRQCVKEQNFAFFVGSFWATEIMSAKRCYQLRKGLLRSRIDGSKLDYLTIHADSDCRHAFEIIHKFIHPLLEKNPEMKASFTLGIEDRLKRSEQYLKWYYKNVLLLPEKKRSRFHA